MLFLTGPLYTYYGFSFGFVCMCKKGISACENVCVSASVCVSWAFLALFLLIIGLFFYSNLLLLFYLTLFCDCSMIIDAYL